MAEVSEKNAPRPNKRPSNKRNRQVLVLVVLLVVAVGAAVYFWQDARDARSETPEQIAARNEEESNQIISELDMILLTESDAEPTVARVEEPQVLRDANPDFYKNVEEGDYLVLYPQRAIIYRSTEKRVINVAPIIDTSQLTAPPAESTTPVPETTP